MDGIKSDGVGLWGISKGAEISLCLAPVLKEKIKALVAVNGSPRLFLLGYHYKDQLRVPPFPARVDDDGVWSFRGWDSRILDAEDKFTFRLGEATASIMLVAGEDDQMVSPGHARLAAEFAIDTGGVHGLSCLFA